MKPKLKYSITLKILKKEFKNTSIKLRKLQLTKTACEDSGYFNFYPFILQDLAQIRAIKSVIKKDIKVYSKLIKGK